MIKQIDARISRKLASIRRAFRGIVTLVNAAGPVQLVQGEGLKDEKLQGTELFQQFGYTSNPPAGTMYVVLPVGGKTAHSIIIATEHGTYRLKNLKPGEVALYTDEGDSIILKRGRIMEVTTQTFRVNAATAIELNSPSITGTAGTSVSFNTPVIHASAAIVAQGDITDNAATLPKTMAGMRYAHDHHEHPENNVPGGNTGLSTVMM